MEPLEIHVDAESLSRGTRNIVGTCFIKFGELSFPDAQWSDFVVIILAWWLRTIEEVQGGESADLFFMDGPFLVRLRATGGGNVHVELIEERVGRTITHGEGSVSLAEITQTCLLAASRVLDACAERGWRDGAVDELSSLVGTRRAV